MDEDLAMNEIHTGDCRKVLASLSENYFSCCVTDPPYNYEFIGHNWDDNEIERRIDRVQNSSTLIKNIPYGSGLAGGVRNARWYENNRRNIGEYRDWCVSWSKPLFRTMRPGAYCMVFNSTRTIAHVQVGLEEAGFYTRDILVYRRHSGIPKGLNVAKKLRSNGVDDWQKWMGWHSCLRNEWEAICIVQKPLIDNYLKTLERSGVGLLRTQLEEDGAFQSNILEGFKRNDDDSASASEHCTVKPQALIRFLIEMTVPPQRGHVIVDPFAGTGTTCVAAKELGHDYVGIEISPKYADHARKRLDGCLAANPDGQRQKARVDSEGSEAKSKQGELFY